MFSRQDCEHWGSARGISYCTRGIDVVNGHSVKVIDDGMCEGCDIYKKLEEKYRRKRNGSKTN